MSVTPSVRIASSQLEGRSHAGVARWLGIPYAMPPVGARRFAPPVAAALPAGAWQSCEGPVTVAPQLPSRLAAVMGDFAAHPSEDCLQLGIWAPEAALHDGRPRPVVVWLHGGAWVSGGGFLPWYDGSHWAREADVVVVGVNHRLGALGWLAGDDAQAANLGLQDIALALDWVHTHIHAFGGDAGRITAMGQSAGGANIAALLQRDAPGFQQAIVQSAPLGRPLRTADEARAVRALVLAACGVSTLAQARELPLEALLRGQHSPSVLAGMNAQGIAGQPFCVVADGLIVPASDPHGIGPAATRVPSVVGATREEMTAFPGMQRTPAHLAVGWQTFNDGAQAWQQAAHAAQQACWRYEFQFGPNPTLGACHCIDLPFTFGTLPAFAGAAMLQGGHMADMQALSGRWRQALQRFVVHGDPGWEASTLHPVSA